MTKSVFDTISVSVFDDIADTIFDKMDAEVEDKVVYSKELKELLREEIIKKIGELPLGSIIASAVKREMQKKLEKETGLRSVIERRIRELDSSLNEKFKEKEEKFLNQIEELEKKLKETQETLKKEMNKPIYEFGGFSPSFNYSNVFYFGDQNTEGSWRIVVSGNDLNAERLESGSWVFKGGFNP